MGKLDSRQSREARHRRIRARVSGTAERPRLCVFRSLNHIYVQAIDDVAGKTLFSACSLSVEAEKKGGKNGAKVGEAEKVGSAIGTLAKEKGITEVVFDRGGYKYHGRVKAVAEAARKSGLKF